MHTKAKKYDIIIQPDFQTTPIDLKGIVKIMKLHSKNLAAIVSVLIVLSMVLSSMSACVTTGNVNDGSTSESLSEEATPGTPTQPEEENGDLTPPDVPVDTGISGDLSGPDIVLPGDTPKEDAPENPAKPLFVKTQDKYTKSDGSRANLGCRAITVLAQYNVGVEYDIQATKDTTDKMFYICLPSRADLSKVTFKVTHYDGSESGPYTADLSDNELSDNERAIGNTSTYTIKGFKSDRPALMLQVDETHGTVDAMNGSGNHSVYAYGDMLITVTDEMALANGWTTRYESIDEDPDEHCSMEMRGRGNATWGYPKKGYQFKLETNMDLLGLGRSDTFVLLANYNDATLMRNQIALWFGSEIGCDFTSKFCQVDFYLNGEYMGLYMLAEKCDIGENRIEIDKNEDYLYEVNQKYLDYGEYGFLSKHDSLGKIRLHSPLDKLEDAKEIFYAADAAAYGNNEQEFLKYFDLESWAKAYIVQQITMNHDAYWGSFYFYYDHIDGKLHACTPWDFDYSMGISWASKTPSAKDAAENPRKYDVRSHYLIEGMIKFDSFKKAIVDVYYKQGVSSVIKSIPDMIDIWAEENRLGAEINAIVAPVRWYPDYEGGKYTEDVTTYDEAVKYLKWIIEPRIQWFDEEMQKYLDDVGLEPGELNGSGTESDPYVIDSYADILSFVLHMNEGENFDGKYLVQTNDIDAGLLFFGLSDSAEFCGEYDGAGHSIEVSLSGSGGCLFPNVKGVVMNLIVYGEVDNEYHSAGIARSVSDGGKIVNCISYAELSGRLVGGITVEIEDGGKVIGCTFLGSAELAVANGKLDPIVSIKSSSNTAKVLNCWSIEGIENAISKDGCTLVKADELNKIVEGMNNALDTVAEQSGIDRARLLNVVQENGEIVFDIN